MTAARRYYPEGVHEVSETLVIPHHHTGLGRGVTPPFLSNEYSLPSSHILGKTRETSILQFSPAVTGALLKTEYYGTTTPALYWNSNNMGGDTSQVSILGGTLSNFGIVGQAGLRPYPYAYTDAWTLGNDPYGVEFVTRAIGIGLHGVNFNLSNLHLFDIPGIGIHCLEPTGPQDGAFGIYDGTINRFSNINVTQTWKGVVDETSDSKWSHCDMGDAVKDIFTAGNATYLDHCHFLGGDRAFVATQACFIDHCYFEAARIGTYIPSTASGTRIDGLMTGPGTCWERNILIEANGVEAIGLTGSIQAISVAHPDIAGLEIASGLVHGNYQGGFYPIGLGSIGVIFRGHRSTLNYTNGGWNDLSPTSTIVKVDDASTNCLINIQGSINGGIVLDLSSSNLNNINGLGNTFVIRAAATGGGTLIKYPGGGTSFNLADGNLVYLNGELQ